MPTVILNAEALDLEATRRGLSLTALCQKAGITSRTQSRISRGLPVRAATAARLETALSRFPVLRVVEIQELVG